MMRESQENYQTQKLRSANPVPYQIEHQMQDLLNQEFSYNFMNKVSPSENEHDSCSGHDHQHRHGNTRSGHHGHHGHRGTKKHARRTQQSENSHDGAQAEFDEYTDGQAYSKSYRTQPAPKNIVVLFYTVFTIVSCVFLQTQYFRTYQKTQALQQYLTYFSYADGLMCLYSYFITVVVSNSIIKKTLLPPSYEKVGSFDPQHSIKRKICNPCGYYKMPRMSHCNTCATCIYKLDHHCVWTQNCVGYKNQKAFYLFTLYMTIGLVVFWYQTYHVYSGITNQTPTETNPTPPKFFGVFPWYIYIWWGITCVSASIVGIMIIALCISHILMILTNFTTLDTMKKRRCFPIPFIQWRSSSLDAKNGNLFDRGQIQNVKQIFGDEKCIMNVPLLFALIPTVRLVENEYTIQKMTPQPSKLQLMKFTNQINKQIDRDHELRRIIKKLGTIYEGRKMKIGSGQVITI